MAELTVKKLSGWKRAVDPAAPATPAFHHPDRCMHCGHLKDQHNSEVGCLVEGGTKYIQHEDGEGARCCSCYEFVPAPIVVDEEKDQ